MQTVYDKIAFFRRQCLLFAANRERDLPNTKFDLLKICVDRQEYRLNWKRSEDRRNVVLQNLASADMDTGYVFASVLNYDPHVLREQIEEHALSVNDLAQKPAFRRYARLWLPGESQEPPTGKPKKIEGSKTEPQIFTDVKRKYAEIEVRADVEVSQEDFQHRKLPENGMLIHAEYTLYAHMFFLKHMLAGADKIVFYLDQESGIRAACHSAFWIDILSKRVDAFYVKIDKGLTIDEKKRLVAYVKRQKQNFLDENEELEEADIKELRKIIIQRELAKRIPIGPWDDYWLPYPFPNMSEPMKAVCWLTDIGGKTITQAELAEMFYDASLHGVDRYFMQLRRKTSLLERPIKTASGEGRTWYAYDAYNPKIVEMMVDIYRVYYNYVKVGDDGLTPACRLGLAKNPIRIEDILYYKPTANQISVS